MSTAGDREPTDAALQLIAARLRLDVFRMVTQAGSGHIDSSFSVIDILTTLYFAVMRTRPAEPHWPDRDRLVLSKGHAAPALYTALAFAGFFPRDELWHLRQPGSHLQGHPRTATPGVDAPSGSLGQGLSVAVGMALGLGMRPGPSRRRVFAVLSDGELDEGQTWEAITFAGHQRLDNLFAIIDHNNRQYSTRSKPMFAPEALAEKLIQFGWDARVIDGHSIPALREQLSLCQPRPRALVARTVKGRGVSFMEDTQHWHGKVPDAAQAERALAELRETLAARETAAAAVPAREGVEPGAPARSPRGEQHA
jgi:transketolase